MTLTLTYKVAGSLYNPAFHLYTNVGLGRYCTPADCTILEMKITDNLGNTYAPVYNAAAPGVWSSPTAAPSGATLYGTVRYRLTPADGSIWYGGNIITKLGVTVFNNTQMSGDGTFTNTEATTIAGTTGSYLAPDQHNFGDLAPASTGTPLVLPAPSSGSLNAKLLWNGPAGTTMTRKIGSGSASNVKPGTIIQLDTAGNGLQVDLHASETAEPGPISGNLTLPLTCP